jgi:hypothetical protein
MIEHQRTPMEEIESIHRQGGRRKENGLIEIVWCRMRFNVPTIQGMRVLAEVFARIEKNQDLNPYQLKYFVRSLDNNSDYAKARDLGRKGGLKGGRQRTLNLTPDRRSEIAKMAAFARWAKK